MKGFGSLLGLLLIVSISTLLTAAPTITSFGTHEFNGTLRSECKSTLSLPNDVQLVVIDAGHGGRDPGGLGRHCQEKDIALSVAKKLKSSLEARFPTIEFVLTRDSDFFIPLAERTRLANEEGADLFISIHANIARNREAYGTETFVMGDHAQEYNLRVAKRENAVIGKYERSEANDRGPDPYTNEGHIALSHLQGANLNHSITFAGLVENEFATKGRKSRGVKQAGFMVLKRATMPAVLIELGFMSNDQEEAYLMSNHGQNSLAGSIKEAFTKYVSQVQNLEEVADDDSSAYPTPNDVWTASDVSPSVLSYTPPKPALEPAAPSQPVGDVNPVAITINVNESVSIGIQLAALSQRTDIRRHGWDALPYPVVEIKDGDTFRYQIRDLANGAEARQLEADLKKQGVSCLVVAYAGQQRLTGQRFTAVVGK